MNIAEGRQTLHLAVGSDFESLGFLRSKDKSRYIRRQDGSVDVFSVRLSKRGNRPLFHHLTLEHSNERVARVFGIVSNKVSRSLGLPALSPATYSDIGTCSVTDWKALFTTLPNSRPLWFTSCDNLFVDDERIDAYRSMIRLGVSWFERMRDLSALLTHCLEARTTRSFEQYLTATAVFTPSDLANAYRRITEANRNYFGWDKNEVTAFYEVLNATSE